MLPRGKWSVEDRAEYASSSLILLHNRVLVDTMAKPRIRTRRGVVSKKLHHY